VARIRQKNKPNNNNVIEQHTVEASETVWNEDSMMKLIRQNSKPFKKPEDFLPLRKLGRGSFGDVYLVKEI
jgi:hypothetical protein